MAHRSTDAVPNVLIVDDDREFRELLSMVIADAGFASRQARDGEEGLTLLRALRQENPATPCVVLLDLMMPRLNGRGFMDRTAGDPALAETPVVIISAVADMARFGEKQPAAVLTKPVDVDQLVDVIRAHCAHG